MNSFADASKELLRVTENGKLPFKLRYHQATERELRSTIARQMEALGSVRWSQALSRSASKTQYLSGIELKYHQLNATTKMDVSTFLSLYEHLDILLKEKNIDIFRARSDRLGERAKLINEYKDFLDVKGRSHEKTYEIIDHDATVLDTVHQLRTSAKSSLEAGALLVTCDHLLYRFDWETSRAQGRLGCVVLPHLFLQLLRPFINIDADFDRSFAETFAIPEFRAFGSSATSKACSKMLSYLALYKSLPEETATKLLSNSLLLDNLGAVEDDKQFHEYIESAIAVENNALLEEKVALEKQIMLERREKAAKERESIKQQKELQEEKAKTKQVLLERQKEIAQFEKKNLELAEKSSEVENLKLSNLEEIKQKKLVTDQAKQELEIVQRRIAEESSERKKTEQTLNIYSIVVAIMLSCIIIVGFELVVHWSQWHWLLENPNSYGLQLAFDVFLALVIFGALRPRWRKWCWGGSGAFAIILVIIQIIGGPK